uniref:F-box domain-containing protein n=1 Tax=Mycena chlorophos TaxID=658473 RepID=A0ABQ0L787_MYCCL|nr:predicted protein [Mycena chlorophos]
MAILIPPELIDAIVEHIPDVASLKSCSLASPIFRFPCQKRLHHTLKLEFAGPNSRRPPERTLEAVSRRFEEFPRLAGFITHLTLEIASPWPQRRGPPPDDQSAFARRVLNSIARVKKVTISMIITAGRLGGKASWSSLPPDLGSAVLEWLAHRGTTEPLQELVLRSIKLPDAVPPVIFSATASLALYACTLEHMPASQQEATVQPESAPQVRVHPRALRRFEAHASWGIVELLATPRQGHHSHFSALRSLALSISNYKGNLEMFPRLCALSANTLTSLELWPKLQSISSESRAFLLQRFTTTLPCLREVRVMLHDYGLAHYSELATSLWVLQNPFRPALLPRLVQITYSVSVAHSPNGAGLPPTFESEWLTPHDKFIVDHPTLTSIVWETRSFRSEVPLTEHQKHQQHERFRKEMQRLMPMTHGKDLLVFRRGD